MTGNNAKLWHAESNELLSAEKAKKFAKDFVFKYFRPLTTAAGKRSEWACQLR